MVLCSILYMKLFVATGAVSAPLSKVSVSNWIESVYFQFFIEFEIFWYPFLVPGRKLRFSTITSMCIFPHLFVIQEYTNQIISVFWLSYSGFSIRNFSLIIYVLKKKWRYRMAIFQDISVADINFVRVYV